MLSEVLGSGVVGDLSDGEQQKHVDDTNPQFVLRGHKQESQALCYVRLSLFVFHSVVGDVCTAGAIKDYTGSLDCLISGDHSGIVIIWNQEAKRPLVMFQAHHEPVLAVCCPEEQCGRVQFTQGKEGSVKIWDVSELVRVSGQVAFEHDLALAQRTQGSVVITTNTGDLVTYGNNESITYTDVDIEVDLDIDLGLELDEECIPSEDQKKMPFEKLEEATPIDYALYIYTNSPLPPLISFDYSIECRLGYLKTNSFAYSKISTLTHALFSKSSLVNARVQLCAPSENASSFKIWMLSFSWVDVLVDTVVSNDKKQIPLSSVIFQQNLSQHTLRVDAELLCHQHLDPEQGNPSDNLYGMIMSMKLYRFAIPVHCTEVDMTQKVEKEAFLTKSDMFPKLKQKYTPYLDIQEDIDWVDNGQDKVVESTVHGSSGLAAALRKRQEIEKKVVIEEILSEDELEEEEPSGDPLTLVYEVENKSVVLVSITTEAGFVVLYNLDIQEEPGLVYSEYTEGCEVSTSVQDDCLSSFLAFGCNFPNWVQGLKQHTDKQHIGSSTIPLNSGNQTHHVNAYKNKKEEFEHFVTQLQQSKMTEMDVKLLHQMQYTSMLRSLQRSHGEVRVSWNGACVGELKCIYSDRVVDTAAVCSDMSVCSDSTSSGTNTLMVSIGSAGMGIVTLYLDYEVHALGLYIYKEYIPTNRYSLGITGLKALACTHKSTVRLPLQHINGYCLPYTASVGEYIPHAMYAKNGTGCILHGKHTIISGTWDCIIRVLTQDISLYTTVLPSLVPITTSSIIPLVTQEKKTSKKQNKETTSEARCFDFLILFTQASVNTDGLGIGTLTTIKQAQEHARTMLNEEDESEQQQLLKDSISTLVQDNKEMDMTAQLQKAQEQLKQQKQMFQNVLVDSDSFNEYMPISALRSMIKQLCGIQSKDQGKEILTNAMNATFHEQVNIGLLQLQRIHHYIVTMKYIYTSSWGIQTILALLRIYEEQIQLLFTSSEVNTDARVHRLVQLQTLFISLQSSNMQQPTINYRLTELEGFEMEQIKEVLSLAQQLLPDLNKNTIFLDILNNSHTKKSTQMKKNHTNTQAQTNHTNLINEDMKNNLPTTPNKQIKQLKGYSGSGNAIIIYKDRYLASTGLDGTINVWKLQKAL